MADRIDVVLSLRKGFAVLTAVNERPPAKVSELMISTGLPKATLIRILNTLVAEGYVAAQPRREGGGYIPTPKVRQLSSAFAHGSPLAQVARPLLVNLSSVVKWPIDLLVRDGLSMLIEASNRDTAPITLKRFEQNRFPLLTSGSGLVYLAWLPDDERRELVTAALAVTDMRDARRITAETVFQKISEIRERGWGWRDYESPIEGTRAISVPIVKNGRPIATTTLIALRDIISMAQFQSAILPHINRFSEELIRQL